jgi:uncharacterized protein YbjT (DUF2867 family)
MNIITSGTIGVVCATGKTGRRVADRLEADGHSVRRLARSTSPAFDWTTPEGWPTALAGLTALYVVFVPDVAAPGADATVAQLLAVAREAGVERVVLLTGRGEDGARRAEDVALASGIATTIVRAAWFSQNFTEGMLVPVDGVIALPAGERREPFVDVDDIADVAVAALTGDGHAGRVYEVTGPELLTFSDAAGLIAEASGRSVEYVALDLETFRAAVAQEAGDELADLLTELCREVFDGRNECLADGVQQALGREPWSLRDVLARAGAVVVA